MKPDEVLEYYGSCHYFNKKTGMSANTLWNWLQWGRVPFLSQVKIEKLTEGKLKANWEDSESLE